MFILNLFVIFTTMFLGIHTPHPASTPTPQKNVKAVSTFLKPLHPASVSARDTTASPSANKKLVFVACIGPDKKHFFATQEDCEAFNTAWTSANNQGTTTTGWGIAQKVGDHTYTMRFAPDPTMATPQEVFQALNAYRHIKGVGSLTWDTTLATYAQSRADAYSQKKNLDAHAGFLDYVNNQNGFAKLGFNSLGENAAYAGPVSGVHLIEWIFAGDAEHDNNQLDPKWSHVGIGITDKGIDCIFGGNKR